MKKQVNQRALATRLDRYLGKRGQTLRKCNPNNRWYRELGNYYIIDVKAGAITAPRIDLEALARKEGVLKAWEELS